MLPCKLDLANEQSRDFRGSPPTVKRCYIALTSAIQLVSESIVYLVMQQCKQILRIVLTEFLIIHLDAFEMWILTDRKLYDRVQAHLKKESKS